MKKRIIAALFSGALLLGGCAPRPPEDKLRDARAQLEESLLNDAMTQSEMTILSEFQLKLVRMERYLTEYRIWNQPGYAEIEKEFVADCEAWDRKAAAEFERPSEYEGGSLAPMDVNLRMVHFEERRIEELNTKWRKP